ncbi:MAG TPA: HEAT repeat domain-containing protein [Vulgatibacter sp.]|nr:HEAT repeat domain-containing protein [Vulgatibacter sp.]
MTPSARTLGRAGAVLLALAASWGCRDRAAPAGEPFVPVEVASDRLATTWLGIDAPAVASRAAAALRGTGRLAPIAPDAKEAEAAWTPRLEIAFVRALPPSTEGGLPAADVGVRLGLARASGDRLRAEGRGQADLPPGDPVGRQDRFRRALDAALADASSQIAAQLQAVGLSDEELIDQLSSDDPMRRDLAMRTLADRQSAAAIPALVARLRADDRDLQLRAVGALVEIGDPAASAALVETTTQRDPAFVIQVIYALAELGGPDAEAYLFTASTGHPDPAVRAAAAEARRALERKHPPQVRQE